MSPWRKEKELADKLRRNFPKSSTDVFLSKPDCYVIEYIFHDLAHAVVFGIPVGPETTDERTYLSELVGMRFDCMDDHDEADSVEITGIAVEFLAMQKMEIYSPEVLDHDMYRILYGAELRCWMPRWMRRQRFLQRMQTKKAQRFADLVVKIVKELPHDPTRGTDSVPPR